MRLEPCSSSGSLSVTTSSTVFSGPGIIQAVVLNPGGAATSTITLYDPPSQGVMTSTNAVVLASVVAPVIRTSATFSITGSGVEAKNGCVAVVAGGAATFGFVLYAKEDT